MNVIVSNKYQPMLESLDIDIIKSVNGEFDADEIISTFQNFFFQRMILDITAIKDYRNMVENRSPNTYCPNNCPDVFMFGTRMALKNVFNALIDYENKLKCMRRNYTTLRLKLRDIFNLIDPCCTGAFKSEDLDNYLKKKCLFRNPKDEDLLFIRLDKNRDGKVDYCEFEDELQPQY